MDFFDGHFSAVLYLKLLFSCVHSQTTEFEQKATKGTKSRSSPRPLFPSLPSVKWIEGLSLVAAALLQALCALL
jgi:hypothetical protein